MRVRAGGVGAWWGRVVLMMRLASLVATLIIRPELLNNYKRCPICCVILLAVAASLCLMLRFRRKSADKAAFLASCAYLVFMLVGAAAGVYPNLLVSTTDPSLNITVFNAASGEHSLSVGLIWWSFGMALAVAYFVFLYPMFSRKVRGDGEPIHSIFVDSPLKCGTAELMSNSTVNVAG